MAAKSTRREHLARDLMRDKLAGNDNTHLEDERIDAITERVIAYMDKTPVDEWTPQLWALYQKLWQDVKARRKNTSEELISAMTTPELLALTNSDET